MFKQNLEMSKIYVSLRAGAHKGARPQAKTQKNTSIPLLFWYCHLFFVY